MKIAVASAADVKYPVFQFIDKNWPQVYGDQYFRIYRPSVTLADGWQSEDTMCLLLRPFNSVSLIRGKLFCG